ncbi:MAG TPA: cell division protein ZipA C-terminal FtsZ-binding domain-containing protein [Steroidobacteraceae bacterium]|jgi:cell division protein ZipA|nr:cell division protein ZipA C-terminal FtsZ-binding domain-containing protein [Steroidobacteraceae bacterium]
MSELRWTLLILGVVFIAALSWWERRRPRQAFAPRLRETRGSSFAQTPPREAQRSAGAEPMVSGEPWIGEAGLSEVVSSDMALTDEDDAHDSAGDGVMHAHVEAHAPGPLDELPTLIIPDEDKRVALKALWDEPPPPEPTLIDPEAVAPAAPEPADAQPTDQSAEEPEIRGAEGVGAVRIVESPYGDGVAPPEPIVDWPPEESRRILAMRLIAPQSERFAGRALRMALAAEGFLLGKFAIFHKPDEANRAVVSAASLTRPGAFDLGTMDSQRYGGLSLFAVLPGPKTPQQAFEELLAAARNLNDRLEGALQDERGGPLTPLRVASIRENLRAEAAACKAAAGQ